MVVNIKHFYFLLPLLTILLIFGGANIVNATLINEDGTDDLKTNDFDSINELINAYDQDLPDIDDKWSFDKKDDLADGVQEITIDVTDVIYVLIKASTATYIYYVGDVSGNMTFPTPNGHDISNYTTFSVPEPTSLVLFGIALVALLGFGFGIKRFRKKNAPA